jgi:hypothetical protein
MPSTRSQPLNPAAPVSQLSSATTVAAKPRQMRAAAEPPSAGDDELSARERAARAGGFHESSYELKYGLDVDESEWPPETTIPGALGPS